MTGFDSKQQMAANKLEEPAQPVQNHVWRISNKVAAFYFWSEDAARKSAATSGATLWNVTPVSLVDVAQPTQEPDTLTIVYQSGFYNGKKAAQRPWVGLTDDDKYEFAAAQHSWEDLCIAVENKLKEKNI